MPRVVLVLFDLDGVITHHDTLTSITSRMLRRSRWRMTLAAPAVPLLYVTRDWPRFQRYPARYLVWVSLLGWNEKQAAEYLSDAGRVLAEQPGWLVGDGVRYAKAHVAQGDQVVVTTATEGGLARSLLDTAGLSGVALVASELRRTRTGLRLVPHNYWRTKPMGLQTRGFTPPWSVVYSDSLADLPLLLEAENAVLINPTRRTARAASRVLGTSLEIKQWN